MPSNDFLEILSSMACDKVASSLLKFEILLASEHLKYRNNDAYVFDEIKAAHCLQHTVIH